MTTPVFLEVDHILTLHRMAVEAYQPELLPYENHQWVRDPNMLVSAVHAPQATFGGDYLYKDIAAMAAAYWHGLVVNHAFVDGNKRVGLAACSTFLRMNGLRLTFSSAEAESLTIQIATGALNREELAAMVRSRCAALAGN